jgi:hypothetical protein
MRQLLRAAACLLFAASFVSAPVLGAQDAASTSNAIAGIAPAKVATIRSLIEATGQANLMRQSMRAMVDMQQGSLTQQLPPEFFNVMLRMADERMGEMMDALIPIYARQFSQEELDELVAFYRSPLGQRLVKATPAITRESMEAGRQWGIKLGTAAAQEVMNSPQGK